MSALLGPLAQRIHADLPQTQCTRCGYPDCAGYAQAIEAGEAQINQCPPGGAEGIARLAALTGGAVLPLNPLNGVEGPRGVAVIDENWCIGCTLCLDACPTDAIMGSNKLMHTVIAPYCTGCELCIPVCPVDCISLETVSGERTGWRAWSAAHASEALRRYEFHQAKALRPAEIHRAPVEGNAVPALAGLPSSPRAEGDEKQRKREIIEAALEGARERARSEGAGRLPDPD